MSDPNTLPGKLWAYLLERFPPVPTLVYGGALFCVAWGLAGRLPGARTAEWSDVIVGSLVFFLALLHVRLMDEHKDHEDDRIAHPQRLLSRGVVTLTQLKGLLAVVLVAEVGLAATLGIPALLVWIGLFAFTLLMLVEFGVGSWLSRHLGWYLISHQAMVLLMALFAASARVSLPGLDGDGWCKLAVLGLGMICATVTFELGRKTWNPEREHEHADSYTRAWGRPRAAVTTLLVAVAGAVAWAWLLPAVGASWIPVAVTGLLVLLLSVAELLFLRRPDKRHSKLVELAGALYALGALIGAAVGFVAAA
jgi:4-hydroxybenzoate polyprenyltransferase